MKKNNTEYTNFKRFMAKMAFEKKKRDDERRSYRKNKNK